jgi:hypothetical protein
MTMQRKKKTKDRLDAFLLRICLIYFHPVGHFFIMLLITAPFTLAPFVIAGQFSKWSVIGYLIVYPFYYETVLELIFRYTFDGKSRQQVWDEVLADALSESEEELDDEATSTNSADTNKRT